MSENFVRLIALAEEEEEEEDEEDEEAVLLLSACAENPLEILDLSS